MVSWDKSMTAAFNVIVCSVVWCIIGIIFIFIGLGLIGSQMTNIMGGFINGKVPDFANFMIGFIIIVIGYSIIICGFLASFMKFLTELIAEEIYESRYNDNS